MPPPINTLGFNRVLFVLDGALTNVPDGPDVAILSVAASPRPVPVNRPVTVTVSAINVSAGADVGGQVLVDGTNVGTTGTPFTHTFRTRRIRIPDTAPREFELVYPTGIVRAAGFPDAPIDFGFPGRVNRGSGLGRVFLRLAPSLAHQGTQNSRRRRRRHAVGHRA